MYEREQQRVRERRECVREREQQREGVIERVFCVCESVIEEERKREREKRRTWRLT